MFRNYLAAALRNLVRNRLFAAITIVGLAVGFAAALLIGLYVRDELTYDHWIPGHERIYRVAGHIMMQGGIDRPNEYAPLIAADALKQEFPEIESFTRLVQRMVTVARGDREFQETLYWADPNLFDVLPLPVLVGDPRTALADPDGVVLTRSLARKYFGRDTPIGETLDIGRQFPLRVTAVLEDLPSNTHLNIGAIASALSARAPGIMRDIGSIDSIGFVYLRLARGASVERLRQELPAFNDRHPEVWTRRAPFPIDRIVAIADIHLRPAAIGAMKPSGNADTAYSALLIAILILAVAGFNFVNLATARAARRAVEVGVRKVSGAERHQLIAQFIGESILYAALGMSIAVGIAMLLLPSFNGFLQRTITLDFGNDPILLATVLAIVAFVGIAAGAYPAFVLSGFSSAAVLKGPLHGRGARGAGRQVLVALQFAVLIVLALGATAVHRQVRYATTEGLRFDKDQILLVTGACLPPLVAEIRALPGVRDTTCTLGRGLIGGGDAGIEIAGPDGAKARAPLTVVDFGTFGLYGLKPVAGRLFSADFSGDAIPDAIPGEKFIGPGGVVIDETLSRALGFATPANAVGKPARFNPPFNSNSEHLEVAPEIVGVVQGFQFLNQNNLRDNVVPRIFFVWPSEMRRTGTLNLKLAGDRIPETLAAIDNIWKKFGPPRPVERVFLDQVIDDVYREFTRLGEIMAVFAGIAVFISCLGLFGLAAFTAEQRTKEIGVRKALGASRRDILRLMLWEFSRPVLCGSLIAWPVGYLVLRQWLDGFADRVDIGLWTFPAATALAFAIALLTVASHALLVARAQPSSALRYE